MKNKFWENNELKDKEIIRAFKNMTQWYEDGYLCEVLEECEEIVRAIKLFIKHDSEIHKARW